MKNSAPGLQYEPKGYAENKYDMSVTALVSQSSMRPYSASAAGRSRNQAATAVLMPMLSMAPPPEADAAECTSRAIGTRDAVKDAA